MSHLVTATVFGEIAALLVLAAGVGFIGLHLRQPLIVSFIGVGLLAGPFALDIARSSEPIDLLSELGIAVLLFLVGIKLDVKLVRALGPVSLITGLGQVGFTALFGFLIGLGLGFEPVASLYIAVALTFSSTIIIVKLLSDKREIDSLHGQVALGFLIVQDLVVVLAMVILSAIGVGGVGEGGIANILAMLGSAAVFLVLVTLFVRHVADALTARLAQAPELLIIFAIAQAAMFAAVCEAIGLGKELGGLLAGVSLASTPYRETITARLAPLRDFLLLFFFIALGAGLDLSTAGGNVLAAVVFSVFVLVGNPLIVLVIMGAMGFRKRTGFLAGLTVAQISEFSLIFAAMGVSIGHLGADSLGLVTLVGLITIAASTYMITYSHEIYDIFEPLLGIFERRVPFRETADAVTDPGTGFDVILFGLGRYGTAIARRLVEAGQRVLCVDFNPAARVTGRDLGLVVIYGDATDPEFLAGLPMTGVKWAISTVPTLGLPMLHDDPRRAILQGLRAAGFPGRIAVASRGQIETRKLLQDGFDLVIEPFEDAADRVVDLVSGSARGPGVADTRLAGTPTT